MWYLGIIKKEYEKENSFDIHRLREILIDGIEKCLSNDLKHCIIHCSFNAVEQSIYRNLNKAPLNQVVICEKIALTIINQYRKWFKNEPLANQIIRRECKEFVSAILVTSGFYY